jgi:hypothetical protein
MQLMGLARALPALARVAADSSWPSTVLSGSVDPGPFLSLFSEKIYCFGSILV